MDHGTLIIYSSKKKLFVMPFNPHVPEDNTVLYILQRVGYEDNKESAEGILGMMGFHVALNHGATLFDQDKNEISWERIFPKYQYKPSNLLDHEKYNSKILPSKYPDLDTLVSFIDTDYVALQYDPHMNRQDLDF